MIIIIIIDNEVFNLQSTVTSREANSFPRAKLEENFELRGTDNVPGQISEHIFTPNGGYCLYYPSNLFRNARNFQNWGMFSDILYSRSRDVLRPIARERNDLMDCNTRIFCSLTVLYSVT